MEETNSGLRRQTALRRSRPWHPLKMRHTHVRAWIGVVGLAAVLSSCGRTAGTPSPRTPDADRQAQFGLASYYGKGFDGKTTASGVRFDMRAMVAAHPTLPFGTLVRVTNLQNGRSARVRIVDRGPAAGPRAEGVVIDVSVRAAEALGFIREGRTRVRLDVLRRGSPGTR
jgi:rare lipoprotein A